MFQNTSHNRIPPPAGNLPLRREKGSPGEEVGLSSYYAAANVPFCDGHTKISWGSGDGTLKTIRTRVYQTRSALVHSKAIMASSRYTHYQDEDQLSKEIPLVKLIAEQIIDNSSK